MSATGSRGASLVEVLVALAIVAVLLASVRLVLPDRGAHHAERAAERTQALLQLACERAELTGLAVGVGFATDRIAFGPLRTGRWSPLPPGSAEALRERAFEPGLQLQLQVDGMARVLPSALPATPQLACSSAGELSGFRLDIRGPSGPSWQVQRDENGGIARRRDDARG